MPRDSDVRISVFYTQQDTGLGRFTAALSMVSQNEQKKKKTTPSSTVIQLQFYIFI